MAFVNRFSQGLFFVFLAGLCQEAFADDDDDEARRKVRLASKPWYMRDTQIGGMTIPISPVTFLIAFFALFNLWRGFHKKSSAVASHILIQSHDDATKQKLDDLSKQIKNDAKKFAEMAAKYSSCPSKAQGGNLGKFYRGDMAPPFDRAVFDPNSKLEQTIGPIETQFGWHLIYIHERIIVE
jgi:peptidyl-prolyl cis-trans isomerase C